MSLRLQTTGRPALEVLREGMDDLEAMAHHMRSTVAAAAGRFASTGPAPLIAEASSSAAAPVALASQSGSSGSRSRKKRGSH
jgi:hypothetical protein